VNQHYIPVISGLETTTAIIDLPTPLVDSKLTFEITVDDTFNNVKKTVDIYVSGTHQFDS